MSKVVVHTYLAWTFFDLNSTLDILESMFRPVSGEKDKERCIVLSFSSFSEGVFWVRVLFVKWRFVRKKLRSK